MYLDCNGNLVFKMHIVSELSTSDIESFIHKIGFTNRYNKEMQALEQWNDDCGSQ